MTWLELFRQVATDAGEDPDQFTEDDVNDILWNRTPYPMGTEQQVREALERWFAEPEVQVVDGW